MFAFTGCSVLPSINAYRPGSRAFIRYWPPPEDNQKLRLAVKDNIDMKGVVTTAGSALFQFTHRPATEDAPCLDIARKRDVIIVGKTNLSEFAISPSGANDHFGTPRNPYNFWWSLIPGGSSCGSAAAVAFKKADVAFGTDTAGSVRVPAACCGIVGLKTTHGLISLEGIHPIEPEHLDTVGPMAKTVEETAVGMDLLEEGFAARYAAAKLAKPTAQGIRIGRLNLRGTDRKIDKAVDQALEEAGFQIVQLNDDFRKAWEQATSDGNTVAAAGTWRSNHQYRYALGVSTRSQTVIQVGRINYLTGYRKALSRRDDWQAALHEVFQTVDFIALPTMQTTPLRIPPPIEFGLIEARMLAIQNTVAVNFAGNPAVAVPIPLHGGGVPMTSLQLVGPRNSEAQLLNAGRFVEAVD